MIYKIRGREVKSLENKCVKFKFKSSSPIFHLCIHLQKNLITIIFQAISNTFYQPVFQDTKLISPSGFTFLNGL